MLSEAQYLQPEQDLDSDQIRARFEADPLGIIRIATAIGEGRGSLPPERITALAHNLQGKLREVDGKQLLEELTRCLQTRDVDVALNWLDEIGFMDWYLPELAATKQLAQEGGRRHKDVWEHTTLVVKQAVRRPEVRWGALLHDIGKVPTRRFTKNGVHFHGHAEVGARMFDKVAKRIPFDKPLRRTIRFLIKYHLRPGQYSKGWTDSAVRRFDREMSAHLVDLLDLSRADITSKRPGKRKSLLRQISTLSDRIEDLRTADAVVPPLKPGIGNAIMKHFALPPSKLVGDIKKGLEKAIADGELEERREDQYYIDWLEGSALLAELKAKYDLAR
ncbi:MAG: HD domain-containing protein [Deltaproteobacteria bacterium]|nr:HD domain-containing protein [Deltaproteobacteria bacterium]